MLLIVSMTTTKRKQANANKYDFLKKNPNNDSKYKK